MSAREETREVRTACPYCGVGCGLIAEVRGGRLDGVKGDPIYPVNRGRVCQKPLALPEASRTPDRATVPLRRSSRDERWREAGWDETIASLADRLLAIRAEHGPGAIAFYISGQLLTEDYYVVNKLAKGFLGTNNVDSNSRLCMSSAVAGYRGSFGADGPPPAYADIGLADCFLLVGTNTAACHPILWARIRDRQAEGATVIVADPRRTETAAAADLHLPVRPGADLALLNAMLHVIESEGLADRRYVERHTEGFAEASEVWAEWPPERAAGVCGVPADDIAAAARRFATAGAAMALWSMGANQSTVGTLKNQALNNLCLATGQIGRPGAGPLSLTGQPNAMGGREVGGLAQLLPGYREVASAAHREEMRALWSLPTGADGVSPEPGLVATDLFEALEDGKVRAVWVCATNPAVSMPDAERARAALRKAELVVCQDAYHPTETSALAHVVLPAAQWPEKDGTMTNSERRVALVRKAIEPPGEARPDWEVFARLGRALGFAGHFDWTDAAAVFDEYVRCTAGRPCDQTGLSHERLRREGGVQWPCPADSTAGREERGSDERGGEEHGGTERLYANGRFPTASGRARLVATHHAEPAERPDAEYPLVLTTGRVAGQWHTMTRTGKSRRLLETDPEPFVEIHPGDAARAGVGEGDDARVVSRRGAATFRARLVPTILEGTAFAPFHWGALHAPAGSGQLNAATVRATDPVSRQPELKACAVRVDRAAPRGGSARSAERPRPAPRRRVVVVGTGMAALATVEAALDHAQDGSLAVTMVGREPDPPYNRIALSGLVGRRSGWDDVCLRPPAWYSDRGIDVRTGVAVEDVDLDRREAEITGGERLPYDALVLATGSQPLMPPIEGLDRDGVFAFRTLEDARRITDRARRSRRAIVIGGGLLGLEAARGLVERGLEVTVVHLVDRLMETQLDAPAAHLLERRMRRLGVRVLRERVTTEVLGDGRVEGLRFASGEEVEGDMVVVSVGIRPEVGLARRLALEIGRGIVVDDELRTSAPGVWAVGECAEHRGTVYGLWSPLLQQARSAGASVAEQPAGYHGSVPATTLKVMGVDLFCAGRHSSAGDEDDEIVAMDGRTDVYRKLVVRDGCLVGAILLGDLALSPRLGELIRRGEAVPDEVMALAPATTAAPEGAGEALVCSCNAVSRAAIMDVVRDRGLERVEQVTAATRAASGCGGCAPAIEELLQGVRAERDLELRAGQAPAHAGRELELPTTEAA
ncbi:MAG: molybdopterin-dependent oxidoreductase [Actinomycetota bacterium]|nr:molybdopterin-dependent oxidoreductase [Actinomycetota bacterium]